MAVRLRRVHWPMVLGGYRIGRQCYAAVEGKVIENLHFPVGP